MIIGLTGRIGSGKDTAYLRMVSLYDRPIVRASFASPLKASASALLQIKQEVIEEIKRDDNVRVTVHKNGDKYSELTFREFLQRYGTESHRDIFGENFWVDIGIARAVRGLGQIQGNPVIVFTDVRFDNEAEAIIKAGGKVFEIIGEDAPISNHSSEAGIAKHMIAGMVYNNCRHKNHDGTIDYTCLDQSIQSVLDSYIL